MPKLNLFAIKVRIYGATYRILKIWCYIS